MPYSYNDAIIFSVIKNWNYKYVLTEASKSISYYFTIYVHNGQNISIWDPNILLPWLSDPH